MGSDVFSYKSRGRMSVKIFAFLKMGNKNDEICSNSYPGYFGASCVSILTVEHLSR